jgi:hypothetical protein
MQMNSIKRPVGGYRNVNGCVLNTEVSFLSKGATCPQIATAA